VYLVDCGSGVFKTVTAETGIIVLRKTASATPTNVTLMEYSKSTNHMQQVLSIPQADYESLVRPWNCRLLTKIGQEDIEVLGLLEDLPRLGDLVTIRRGIETGHNKQSLANRPGENGTWAPVVRGKDISRFGNRSCLYLKYCREELSKPGPSDLLQRPKVIVQQNSRKPIACYDDGHFLVLNSATYISEASQEMLKSVCVFLNSRLMGWFFRKVITNDAGLTVNLLPNNLGLIPLPKRFDTGEVRLWILSQYG